MLNAIVFDFDGVVVDSEPLHFKAFLEVVGSLGYQFDYDQYLRDFVGFDDRDVFATVLALLDKQEAAGQIAQLCADKQKVFDNIIQTGGATPIPGVLELIDQAHGSLPIAIASGATKQDITLMLGHLDRLDRFETIVSADDVLHSKPDPTSYRLAVEQLAKANPKLDLQPRDCLAIEDTVAGIQSATQAGLMTLGLATTTSAQALHETQRVVESLDGITLEKLSVWYG
jgi:beta-phosphoglucomutase